MGIILSALAAAGDSGVQSINQNIEQQNKLDQEDQRAKLATQKDLAIADHNIGIVNAQRIAGVDRVNAAVPGIIAQAQANKLNQYYGDGSNLKPSDISDEEFASPQAQLTQDEMDHARNKAAISTGDIDSKTAATLSQRSDASIAAAAARANHDDAMITIGAGHDDTKTMLAAILASSGGAKGNTDFDKRVGLLQKAGATDQEVANFILERKQPSIEDLANGFLKSDPNIGRPNAMTPELAIQKAQGLRSLTQSVAKGVAPAAPAAKSYTYNPKTGKVE